MKKKRIYIVVIVVIVMVINILWFLNNSMYNSYKKGFEKFKTCYNMSTDEYDFTVKKPDYLSFTGNLAIANKKDTVSIIIWPGVFMKQPFEYGVMIYDEVQQHGYMIYVDENMNFLESEKNQISPEQKADANKVLKKNKHELIKLLNQAKVLWNI